MASRQANFIMKLVDKVSGPARQISGSVGSVRKLVDKANTGLSLMKQKVRTVAEEFEKSKKPLGEFGSKLRRAISVAAIIAFSTSVVQAQRQVEGLDRAISFASGKQAQANFKTLNDTVESLGLDSLATKEGFLSLAGSFRGTKLAGQPMRDLFRGVSSAVGAMNLTGEQAKGTYLALGQIMSKGKVSSEELRGQLGERIPGAFQIAARSMGMTTMELDKMMSTGQLMAEDFLPKFATELQNTFGQDAINNADGLNARLNRMSNRLLDLRLSVFSAFEPLINFTISVATWMLERAIPAVGIFVGFFVRFRAVLIPLIAAFVAYKAIVIGIALVSKIWTVIQVGLNAALTANPIGIVVALIAALASAIIFAYIQMDSFRGFLWGVWAAVKTVFSKIAQAGGALKDILVGVFTFDGDQVKKGISSLKDLVTTGFSDVVSSFSEGFQAGKNNKPKVPSFLKNLTGGGNAAPQASTSGLGSSLGTSGELEKSNSGGLSVSGDNGKSRIVNTTIQAINVVVNVADATGRSLSDVGEEVARVLIGATRDAEIILSNG